MRVVILPAQREAFAKRLTTLNKKCVRFGLVELVASEPTEVLYRRVDSYDNDGALRSSSWKEHSGKIDGRYTYATFLHITITGPVVKSGDWKVVAKLEALGDGILALDTTGDATHAAAAHAISQSGPIRCEHCGVTRRRKDSFVLVNPDGAYKQVGTTCLKDFTGIDPARALFLAALYTEFSGWDEAERLVGGSAIPSYSSTAVIAASLHAIRAWGWVSSSRARGDGLLSTAQQAVALLNGGGSKEFYAAYDALLAEAKAVEEELLGRDAGDDTFISNSQLLVKDGLVPANRVPFLAAVAQRSIADKAKALAGAVTQANSQPVGVAGEKIEVDLTYIGHHIYQNEWGGGAIIKFVDDSGNQYIWSTSSSLEPFKGREGSKCKCKAGVKRHSEFKEQWRTELTRAKIVFY